MSSANSADRVGQDMDQGWITIPHAHGPHRIGQHLDASAELANQK